MKKKGLALVVVLLCMASLLAAMAYTSAEVKAGYTIKVADSAQALLALNFNKSAAAGDCSDVVGADGNLSITFGNTTNGLQPGSTYKWDGLVTLKNNSGKKIKVTVNNPAGGSLAITHKNAPVNNKEIKDKGELPLTFEVTVPADTKPSAKKDLTGNIVVFATTN
jgi:hypothetical protein